MKKQNDFKNFVLIANLILLVAMGFRSNFTAATFGYLLGPLVIFNISLYLLKKITFSKNKIISPLGILILSFVVGLSAASVLGVNMFSWIFILIAIALSFYYRSRLSPKENNKDHDGVTV